MSSKRSSEMPRSSVLRLVAVAACLALAGLLVTSCATAQPPPSPTKAAAAPAVQPTAAAPVPAAAPTKAPAPTTAPKAAWRPTKPPEIIVPAAAGGGQDINARIMVQYAAKYLGQQIAVVNKAGAGGVLGLTDLVQAKPDGMTMGVVATTFVTNQYLTKGLVWTWNSIRPILEMNYEPNVLVVRPGTPVDKPLKELMAYAKQNPGKLRIGLGSSKTGGEFTRATMEAAEGLSFQQVVYNGGAAAIQALLADDVEMACQYVSEVIQHIQSGKLKAVAIAGPDRVKPMPGVPTFKELGYPEISWGVWRMIGVPRATPDEIVSAYHDVFKQTLDDPGAQEALAKAGIDIVYKNSADADKFLEQEDKRYKALIEKMGLKPQ